MGCGCKNVNQEVNTEKKTSNLPIGKTIISYFLKLLTMLIVLISIPIIMLSIIWISFKVIVLNKNIDVLPLLKFFYEKLKNDSKSNDDENDDDDELDDLTEDDVVLLDAEDITNKYR